MSSDDPSTETQFFFPEWVVGIFYGNHWEQVKPGSFKEGIGTDHGEMAVYEDPFNDEIVFVMEEITAYRIKKPPPPPEPQATVHQLHKKSQP